MALRQELNRILGDDLVAMWAHGGMTSVADPAHAGDLDTYVIVARAPAAATERMIEEAHVTTTRDHDVEWDIWYVLADDARRPDQPRHAFHQERRDTSWAINRAHWIAGRYVNLHGPEPSQLVPPPTWDEILPELSRELEHIERHIAEGDTDPFEASYAFLIGSRILHALETHDLGISKYAAGTWALEHVPDRWHPALRAAIRRYQGEPMQADADLLATEMAPFVAMVRGHLPPTDDRAPDAPPRWSGY